MQEVPGVRIQDAGLMLSLMLFSPASCYAMPRQVPAAPPGRSVCLAQQLCRSDQVAPGVKIGLPPLGLQLVVVVVVLVVVMVQGRVCHL